MTFIPLLKWERKGLKVRYRKVVSTKAFNVITNEKHECKAQDFIYLMVTLFLKVAQPNI